MSTHKRQQTCATDEQLERFQQNCSRRTTLEGRLPRRPRSGYNPPSRCTCFGAARPTLHKNGYAFAENAIATLCLLVVLFLQSSAYATDWPCYGGNTARSGQTTEELPAAVKMVWTYHPAQAPSPAWPEPELEMHRLDFDYAFHVAVADGLVFFGSSSDDSVRALDLSTGKLRWRFTADGPVRFAPHVVDGRCYLASDAGYVHCLDAKTGKELWKFDAAMNRRQVLGNGRMISRWPCRAGVLVDDGVLYVAGGMWPAEGVLVYALNTTDGKVIWCNDTSGGQFMLYPHGGSFAIGGVSPQGYLLTTKDKLLIPTGRAVPAAYDRTTGKLLYYRIGNNRAAGGWRVSIAGDSFYTRVHGGKWKMAGPWTRYGPKNGDGIQKFSLADGQATNVIESRHFLLDTGDIHYVAGDGVIESRRANRVLWKTKHSRVFSFVSTANAILVGGANSISAFSRADGSVVWRQKLDGEARGIAVADGRILVSTHTGAITCLADAKTVTGEPIEHRSEVASSDALPQAKSATVLLRGANLASFTKGYALVLGPSPRAFADIILKETQLHVILLETDLDQVSITRNDYLDKTDLYGTRVSVQHVPDLGSLPYPDYFANLIVVTDRAVGLSGKELYRVVRPCGGTIFFRRLGKRSTRIIMTQSGISGSELQDASGGSRVVREKLYGALDWDSEETSDQLLKWPLELSWFGGPGPARMPNRHGTMLPVVANGRYFVVGRNHLIAMDAYNGTELWSNHIKGLLYDVGVVAADDDTVYVNFGDKCVTFDAQTGEEKQTLLRTDKDAWGELPAHVLIPKGMPTTAPEGKRTNPLTGEQEVKAYRRAHGCGSFISSAQMHFFRSATLGMYDLEDDSGLRNFSGVRPGCALSLMPALGILISSEGDIGCTCSYNFQTSLVLTPAAEVRNEDWAIFYNTPAYGITKHLALNFGAPGDRRDKNRLLWLGFPRPGTGLQLSHTIEVADGAGPVRVNADRTEIAGTTDPWLYASAMDGLRKFSIGLEHFDNLVSLRTDTPPSVDGMLNDACWDGQFPLGVNDEDATVYLRHDDANFYLGYRRPVEVDRFGKSTPLKTTLQGRDQKVWEDDSFEVLFSDEAKERTVHIGMSASTASYDGLWTYADPYPGFDIPRIDGVKIDGNRDDWQGKGFFVHGLVDQKGNMRMPNNLDASFHLGWNAEGLLLYIAVRDNVIVEYPSQSAMWMRDSLEIFMSESRESKNRFQLCVGPGVDVRQPKVRLFFWDRRKKKSGVALTAKASSVRTDNGYELELILPWSNLGIDPEKANEVALQVEVNDSDRRRGGKNDWHRVGWHPGGHTGFKPRALHRLRLGTKTSPPYKLQRAAKPDKLGLVKSGPTINIPTINIPRLHGITIDGRIDDWNDQGFHQQSMAAQDATMRSKESFDPSFRMGWNEDGLLVLVQVRDQSVVVDPDVKRLWRKDCIEVFMSPRAGSKESFQLTVAVPEHADDGKVLTHLADNRRKLKRSGKLTVQARGKRTPDGYLVEMLLPWKNLSIAAKQAIELGLQIHVSDSDDTLPYPGDWFRAAWYPHGHAGWNPLAYHRLVLSDKATPSVRFTRGDRINDELVRAAEPYPWTMPLALKGEAGEDVQWNATWKGATQTSKDAFTCELAIPWQALAKAGLDRDNLIIDFSHRGPVTDRPSYSFMPVNLRRTAAAPARLYTVNLHFAEIANVRSGERVFDVRLQGKDVLKGLDVVREAGGRHKAIIKSFRHIEASTDIELELVPRSDKPPFCSAIEIVAE